MNPKDIQALKERLNKASTLEEIKEVAASASPVIDAIVAESERQAKLAQEAAEQSAKIEAARAEAAASAEQLKKDLELVKTELATIKQAQAAAEAEQAFNARMSAIDEVFDFADDEKAEIVADIRGLDGEAFAKWMEKSKKLMKEKTKEHKKKMKEEAEASQKQITASLVEKLNAKGVKVKANGADIDMDEIIASAVNNVVSTDAGTIVQPENSDLKALAAKAMEGMKFPTKE